MSFSAAHSHWYTAQTKLLHTTRCGQSKILRLRFLSDVGLIILIIFADNGHKKPHDLEDALKTQMKLEF